MSATLNDQPLSISFASVHHPPADLALATQVWNVRGAASLPEPWPADRTRRLARGDISPDLINRFAAGVVVRPGLRARLHAFLDAIAEGMAEPGAQRIIIVRCPPPFSLILTVLEVCASGRERSVGTALLAYALLSRDLPATLALVQQQQTVRHLVGINDFYRGLEAVVATELSTYLNAAAATTRPMPIACVVCGRGMVEWVEVKARGLVLYCTSHT